MRELNSIITPVDTNDYIFDTSVLEVGDCVLIQRTLANDSSITFTGMIETCADDVIKLRIKSGYRTFTINEFVSEKYEILKTLFKGSLANKGLKFSAKWIFKNYIFVKDRPYVLQGNMSCFSLADNGCYICTSVTEDRVEFSSEMTMNETKIIAITAKDIADSKNYTFKIFGFDHCYE